LKNGLIVIGNEANGISKENLSKITNPISIPAAPDNKSESLNAAMATAIICAEFFRRQL
jgi:RNA methyltransferase, TrmH family